MKNETVEIPNENVTFDLPSNNLLSKLFVSLEIGATLTWYIYKSGSSTITLVPETGSSIVIDSQFAVLVVQVVAVEPLEINVLTLYEYRVDSLPLTGIYTDTR